MNSQQVPSTQSLKEATCSQTGCNQPRRAAGYCMMHYRRLRQNRSMDAPKQHRGRVLEWLMNHIKYTKNTCLLWPFSRGEDGYAGVVWYEGKGRRASRLMTRLAHGEPPTPKHEAAHACHNGHLGCVNPQHLRWATKEENHKERCNAPRAKEGREMVYRIRANPTASASDLAAELGVTVSTINNIRTKRRWRWLE